MGHILRCAAALIAVSMLLGAPAQAQKAKDTLRLATSGQTTSAVTAENPQPETDLLGGAVFDALLCYDMAKGTFSPLLAKSWRQVDDLTLEFTLRDDVKWQDGSPFTADDVIYTYDYMVDPASKLRFAPRNFEALARIEKVDAHTLRFIAKRVDALELLNVAVLGDILPKKLHSSYATKTDFGRLHPVGTGPYKVVSIDPAGGVTLAKNENYHHGNACKPAAKIGHVKIVPIADAQTRTAQLVTGGIDVIAAVSKDETDELGQDPRFRVTPVTGPGFFYLALDSVDRSGAAAPLSKEKVRQAVVQALDRQTIARSVLAGGDAVHALDALCVAVTRGCDVSVKPYPYDPVAAKKLLAEAGYPDGFDVKLETSEPGRMLSEAIAGALRKVGIRAAISLVTTTAYMQEYSGGKVAMGVSRWGPTPDVATDFDLFFDGGVHDYWHDKEITTLAAEARGTLDLAKRKALYRQIFDRINRQAYVVPLANALPVFIHTADLVVPKVANNRYGIDLNTLSWK